MKLLALGAHPDDLEIFLWGSLCAWKAMGAEITLATATDGARGGAGPAGALSATRRAEAEAAAARLGLAPRFLGFPDGALLPDRPLIEALGALIAETGPDLVLTHAPEDYHADHRALAAAVTQAVTFAAPLAYADTLGGTGFRPSHWIDVTAHFEAKLAAIRCHASQDPERFVTAATTQAAFRAGECNGGEGARAEAIRFEPRFPFADVRALLPPAPPLRPMRPRGDQMSVRAKITPSSTTA